MGRDFKEYKEYEKYQDVIEVLDKVWLKLRIKEDMKFDVGMTSEERFLNTEEREAYKYLLLLTDREERYIMKKLYLEGNLRSHLMVGKALWGRGECDNQTKRKVKDIELKVLRGLQLHMR